MNKLDFSLLYGYYKNIQLKCPICSVEYTAFGKFMIESIARYVIYIFLFIVKDKGGWRAVLLKCSHLICENCSQRKKTNFDCPVCKEKIVVDTNK